MQNSELVELLDICNDFCNIGYDEWEHQNLLKISVRRESKRLQS